MIVQPNQNVLNNQSWQKMLMSYILYYLFSYFARDRTIVRAVNIEGAGPILPVGSFPVKKNGGRHGEGIQKNG
ncbi:MAG: hypothetical protein A2Z02_02865 [Chloroflexi bacterium RBG_16_48_7]|nr:MAG: hypothetical protein A2Z02_02865 [Chloroflexi bacterium RBG_16_48_7]